MALIFADLDAERVSFDLTWRGQTFAVHVNPNDLTEEMGETLRAALAGIDAEPDMPEDGAPRASKYDPLLISIVREWDIAETRADDAAKAFWPVDLPHAARLHITLKRTIFFLMIAKLFNPDPEVLAASSPDGSGGQPSTMLPAEDGLDSGTESSPPATEASTPAN
jgi:hypothetical protein